jgi:hypothetical protein
MCASVCIYYMCSYCIYVHIDWFQVIASADIECDILYTRRDNSPSQSLLLYTIKDLFSDSSFSLSIFRKSFSTSSNHLWLARKVETLELAGVCVYTVCRITYTKCRESEK